MAVTMNTNVLVNEIVCGLVEIYIILGDHAVTFFRAGGSNFVSPKHC